MECEGGTEEPLVLRKEAAPWSGCMAADTSVSLSRWQSGCQGVIVQYPLGPAQMSYLTHITDALSMGTTDDLFDFNHPLWSLSVLGCARTRPDYDVSVAPLYRIWLYMYVIGKYL